ncbi:hypothetical protein, partial [Methanoculleus horonobensis]|uniref:hypothetical protein n=1 Tax=Methanoculleus horonobensis TaxID=528314 RepID=UPI001F467000
RRTTSSSDQARALRVVSNPMAPRISSAVAKGEGAKVRRCEGAKVRRCEGAKVRRCEGHHGPLHGAIPGEN